MPLDRIVRRSATRVRGRPAYGDIAFASFVVAIASGILLALPYDVRRPYESVALLRLTNPAASYFRNVHYWSAQLFLIFTAVHIWDHLQKSSERRVPAGAWVRLVFSIPLAVFVMVSGFILKGDAEGTQAWRIISAITASLPVVGRTLSAIAFGASNDPQVLYVHHIATASIFLWLLVAEHARALWPRPAAALIASAPVAVAAFVLSPGLHDGLDPMLKGPWYFVGLQEALHWLSRPAWAIAGGFALLVAVLALRWTPPVVSRGLRRALVTTLAGYVVLTLTGEFFRGENWLLRRPRLAGVSGMTFTRPAALFGAPSRIADLREVPVVLGRPEGCLVCHAGTKGFSPAHDPNAMGCASCHSGDPFTLDKVAAHRGMAQIPGNMTGAARACGTAQCHPAVVDRVERSLMTSMTGVISVDRKVFGEAQHGNAAARVDALGHSPADTHLRQLCVSCHLGAIKTELGPVHEDSRGGGCNACHLVYSPAARQALDKYQQSAGQTAREAPLEHPRLSIDISSNHCFGCHSRSSRISTSYEGWMETERRTPDPRAPDRYRTLEDGRVFTKVEPDVHFTRKLECVDCHTAREVMGDGASHARKSDQIEVGCEDCHLRGRATTIASSQLDPESLRILSLRQSAADRAFLTAQSSGKPLINAFVDAMGRPSMSLKLSGDTVQMKRPAAVCLEGGGHSRLSCGSCHTAWAPRCPTCHTAFDRRGAGVDLLTGGTMSGDWVETAGDLRADPPTLGVRLVSRTGTPAAGVVETFVPGMILDIQRPGSADVFQRLYARTASHTITRTGRSCESCHNDPTALGYGRGDLRYVRAGDRGRWTFAPVMPRSVQDGLPADAWIPFLGTRTGFVSTRDDVRPFNVDEQKAILTAGACLTCHPGNSRVMRDAIADFSKVRARMTTRCLAPKWN